LISAQDYQLNGRVSIMNSRVDNGPIKYIKNVKAGIFSNSWVDDLLAKDGCQIDE